MRSRTFAQRFISPIFASTCPALPQSGVFLALVDLDDCARVCKGWCDDQQGFSPSVAKIMEYVATTLMMRSRMRPAFTMIICDKLATVLGNPHNDSPQESQFRLPHYRDELVGRLSDEIGRYLTAAVRANNELLPADQHVHPDSVWTSMRLVEVRSESELTDLISNFWQQGYDPMVRSLFNAKMRQLRTDASSKELERVSANLSPADMLAIMLDSAETGTRRALGFLRSSMSMAFRWAAAMERKGDELSTRRVLVRARIHSSYEARGAIDDACVPIGTKLSPHDDSRTLCRLPNPRHMLSSGDPAPGVVRYDDPTKFWFDNPPSKTEPNELDWDVAPGLYHPSMPPFARPNWTEVFRDNPEHGSDDSRNNSERGDNQAGAPGAAATGGEDPHDGVRDAVR